MTTASEQQRNRHAHQRGEREAQHDDDLHRQDHRTDLALAEPVEQARVQRRDRGGGEQRRSSRRRSSIVVHVVEREHEPRPIMDIGRAMAPTRRTPSCRECEKLTYGDCVFCDRAVRAIAIAVSRPSRRHLSPVDEQCRRTVAALRRRRCRRAGRQAPCGARQSNPLWS